MAMIWSLGSNERLPDFLKKEAPTKNAEGIINICDARHAKPKEETPSQNLLLECE